MSEEKIKILVVDDDLESREMYKEVLQKANFTVLEGSDGVEGLDLATRNLPDVIFTGIIMPRMDGFSMMEELKKNVSTSGIPVIIFSHMGREEDQKRANLLGAKDFIVRDLVPPIQAVERIKSIFVKGGSYQIEFNPYSLDAQKLAKDLHLNNNFQCMECDEKMIMNLKLIDVREKKFETKFVCPNYGWIVR